MEGIPSVILEATMKSGIFESEIGIFRISSPTSSNNDSNCFSNTSISPIPFVEKAAFTLAKSIGGRMAWNDKYLCMSLGASSIGSPKATYVATIDPIEHP